MKRVLLLMPTTSYRAGDFLAAADRLGVAVTLGSDRCPVLDALGAVQPTRDSLVLDLRDTETCARAIAAYAATTPLNAAIPLDDRTAEIAARASELLGLPHNDVAGTRAARDKLRLRVRLARAGVPQAAFHVVPLHADPAAAAARIERSLGFPVVLKPRALSGSRGVIRADDRAGFAEAFARIASLLRSADVRGRLGVLAGSLLVERFVPGFEVALEGLLAGGRLVVLALFDKPDPLDGPFFEETLYVTPSRLPAADQQRIAQTVAAAAAALGLREGPIHAELRLNAAGPHLVEIAPRAIGGLCARTLRFGTGMSLESLIVAHAAGLVDALPLRSAEGAGVLMIPIPRSGTLRAVHGLDAARAVPLVEDVVITAPLGREILALPEGESYLGFAFARGPSAPAVEAALRSVRARLHVEISAALPVV